MLKKKWDHSAFQMTAFRTTSRITVRFLKIGTSLVLSGALSSPVHGQATTGESAKQKLENASVLLITLDTTRADHLGSYRQALPNPSEAPRSDLKPAQLRTQKTPALYLGKAKTPSLDALAAEGVRFDHAIAQVPLTLPSHASIMTGTYPPVHGLRDMGGFILEKKNATIATITQSAGFATAAFVGSRVLARPMGFSNGFATYDDDMGAQHEEGLLPGIYPERRASVVTDRALDWLQKNGQKKFFIWVHYYDPHAPYKPPEPYKHIYASDLYSGEIAYVDAQVGRLLDGLSQQGLRSRTLIVVIGDHGESLGQHGEKTHGIFLYDATTHVPFIIAGPGVPSGQVIEDQVRSIDVMPTVLSFLNLPPGKEVQGTDLLLDIQQEHEPKPNNAYSETIYPRTYMGWSELRALRTDSWKLILAPRPELYDLARDPGEIKNLYGSNTAVSEELERFLWDVAGKQSRDEKLTMVPVDAKTREELQALGYAGSGPPREVRLGTAAPDPKDRTEVLHLLNQAESLNSEDRFVRVSQLMEQALKLDPSNPLCHVYQAAALERLGNYQRAARVYQDAITRNIASDMIYSRLGKVYVRLQQVDKAAAAMSRASEMNPTDLDNLRNLGMAYLQMRRPNDAERTFRAVLLQNDHYAAAWNGLGLVATQKDDLESARSHFLKAIEFDPGAVEPLLNLGLIYQREDNKERALFYFRQFLQKAPPKEYSHWFAQVRATIKDLSE
jgi:choline-sulfatase